MAGGERARESAVRCGVAGAAASCRSQRRGYSNRRLSRRGFIPSFEGPTRSASDQSTSTGATSPRRWLAGGEPWSPTDSAAWLSGLWRAKPGEVEVIALIEAGRKIRGFAVAFHRRPSRVIVVDVQAIDRILDENRRRGSRKLNSILEEWRRYTPRMRLRSRMEAKLLPLLTHHSLPIPETNQKLRVAREDLEVDFLWREQWWSSKPTEALSMPTRWHRGETPSAISSSLVLVTGCRVSAGAALRRTRPDHCRDRISAPRPTFVCSLTVSDNEKEQTNG